MAETTWTFRTARTQRIVAELVATVLGAMTIGCAMLRQPSEGDAAAAPLCTIGAAQAAAPAGMKVGPIDDLGSQMPPAPTGAQLVPASGSSPAYCLVTGTIVTNGATGKSANFGIALPLNWNRKFLFSGCDGYCGVVFPTPVGLSLGGMPGDALAKGYAIAATDAGHAATPAGFLFDASWALTERGGADVDAIADFFHRAVHAVTVAGKRLTEQWYRGTIERSYFAGCADGGREGMVEATRYPADFDGYVVGDPFFDVPGQILAGRAALAVLEAPDAYIPPALLSLVDSAVAASCDAADGVKDGLIQNPGRCAFDPAALRCTGDGASRCLSASQVETLKAWFGAARDTRGRIVSLGFAVSDLYDDGAQGANLFAWSERGGPPRDIDAAQPWGGVTQPQPAGWQYLDQSFRYLVFRDSAHDNNDDSPVDSLGVVNDSAMALLEARTRDGRGDDPRKLAPFLASDRKMIMYHGYSDGFVTPFRTVRFYEDWAEVAGGRESLARSARLFMVPGMYHCGGGPGPNVFDALGALEQWVEHGVAPVVMVATKYTDDAPSRPVLRRMPLCRFPRQASYAGTGDVNDVAHWSCAANERLLEIGPNGAQAGLTGAMRSP